MTRDLAGLPESLSNTVRVTVFASSRTLPAGRTALASFAPVAFEQATRTQSRSFEIGELAELPDFSYSFFDWALGNETCPLAGVSADATDCHAFATHMGSVNGNHFLPQGQAFYARDHQLALTRAAECRQMSEQLQHGPPGRFDDYVLACEDEAMAIEAMAQHYLQDAWSMGHMWQRWGSSDLTDAPGATPDEKRARALLVSLSVGLIHGARGLLQAVPGWTTYDVNDAMSAPNDNVRFVSGGRIEHGVGDDYLSEIIPRAGQAPPATYAYQYTQMMSCTSAGMLAVYQATGQAHGPVRTAAPMAHPTVDPLGTECWGQRATNSALLAGAGIQFRLLGRQSFIPMDARFVSWALPTVGTTAGRADIDPLLRNSYRFDMSRAMTMLRLARTHGPRWHRGRRWWDGRRAWHSSERRVRGTHSACELCRPRSAVAGHAGHRYAAGRRARTRDRADVSPRPRGRLVRCDDGEGSRSASSPRSRSRTRCDGRARSVRCVLGVCGATSTYRHRRALRRDVRAGLPLSGIERVRFYPAAFGDGRMRNARTWCGCS